MIHATCVQWTGMGVLLRGASGAGKSDLALRLIDQGAVLVADDQVMLTREGDRLMASPPASLAGLLEVRGLGILRFDHQAPVPVGLVVDLIADAAVERLPEPETITLQGCVLPRLSLTALQGSAPIKVRLAVQQVAGTIMTVR